jgi:hypothetical protein
MFRAFVFGDENVQVDTRLQVQQLRYRQFAAHFLITQAYGVLLHEIFSGGKRPFETFDDEAVAKEVCQYRRLAPQ